jgi:hypothetical protein
LLFCVVAAPVAAGGKPTPALDQALKVQRQIQSEAARSQQRVDALDDESRGLLEELRVTETGLSELEDYNAQMARILEAQTAEVADLERQLEEIEVTRRRVLPLMVAMVEALERFVAADAPFLSAERELRLQALREVLDAPDTGLAEKYRRVLEAYRIESEYGYSIEAYAGELKTDGSSRTVDFLRLGRVGLYYLTFDGAQAGLWDPANDRWLTLDEGFVPGIQQGLRVARKQAPPDLIRLPMRAAPEPGP